jgi:DNA-binding IclR family transcriptional regulator
LKLTKSKLKQLIKEELAAIRSEQDSTGDMESGYDEIADAVCEHKDKIFIALQIPYARHRLKEAFINKLAEETALSTDMIIKILKLIEDKTGYTIEKLLANKKLQKNLENVLNMFCAFR